MDQTVRLAQLHELGEGTMKAFDVSGERIAVAVIDGAYYGFQDARPHLQCPLSEGSLSGASSANGYGLDFRVPFKVLPAALQTA